MTVDIANFKHYNCVHDCIVTTRQAGLKGVGEEGMILFCRRRKEEGKERVIVEEEAQYD
jgi:hypothetical protein